MSRIIKPPAKLIVDSWRPSVFLAGSIELGEADNWQARVEAALAHTDVTILNPRRDDWDSSWEQSIDNPQFREQVEWELAGLELASLVAFFFDPTTKSPITLLEFGLAARAGKAVVCCPPGFWRKGNVDIVCRRYGIVVVGTVEELIDGIRERLFVAD